MSAEVIPMKSAPSVAKKPAAKRIPVPRGSRRMRTAAKKTRLDLLEALRDNIAKQIDEGVAARDLASLSRRLLELATEIDKLQNVGGDDDVSRAADAPDEPWDGS